MVVQKEVGRYVVQRTEQEISDSTDYDVEPESVKTAVDCLPESDAKLSCIVSGTAWYFNPIGDENAEASKDFEVRWLVTVDGVTGRFQALPENGGITLDG